MNEIIQKRRVKWCRSRSRAWWWKWDAQETLNQTRALSEEFDRGFFGKPKSAEEKNSRDGESIIRDCRDMQRQLRRIPENLQDIDLILSWDNDWFVQRRQRVKAQASKLHAGIWLADSWKLACWNLIGWQLEACTSDPWRRMATQFKTFGNDRWLEWMFQKCKEIGKRTLLHIKTVGESQVAGIISMSCVEWLPPLPSSTAQRHRVTEKLRNLHGSRLTHDVRKLHPHHCKFTSETWQLGLCQKSTSFRKFFWSKWSWHGNIRISEKTVE